MLELKDIRKSYDGVPALHPIHLTLGKSEILGLIGENGAGKSTLIKILSGLFPPDAGEILFDGQPYRPRSPADALAAGVATIHQELAYFSHLTVSENLLIAESWPRRSWGAVHWNALHDRVQAILNEFGIGHIAARQWFHRLTAAEKQEVAIARALSRKARLLILDEPTASLTQPEVERLFGHLRRARERGVSIIYVSHRLDEIKQIAGQVAVLRDGELVARYAASEAEIPRMVKDMVGRPVEQVYPHHRSAPFDEIVLQVSGAARAPFFQEISFELRKGEVLGLAGLTGSGRAELMRSIYGLSPLDSGTMRLFQHRWKPRHPREALKHGIVYLPEERKRQSLVLDQSLSYNISIGFLDHVSRWGWIDQPGERRKVRYCIDRQRIRCQGADQPVSQLSGGNQQKAVLARWLEREPSLLILDEPTRGIDVGAKWEIHGWIDALAGAGHSVLLLSSDLPEIIGMSDRVLVFHRGRIRAELSAPNISQERILLAASGL